MAKKIKYTMLQGKDEADNPILADVVMGWSESNEAIAKAEAYNGKYTIEDDVQPEPEAVPTTEERVADLEEALSMILSGVTE